MPDNEPLINARMCAPGSFMCKEAEEGRRATAPCA